MTNNPSYDWVHQWLRKTFGSANHCEFCGRQRQARFHWAKIRGKKYQLTRENFWQLCAYCHFYYDHNLLFAGVEKIIHPTELV